ncbi:methylcrotonyl-CoA carboxylase carboxyl transferase subunit [Desulfocucumis palustris]|uniref:Methylcrotonyl-CoA carboxylase carboxyl transferase subunit n=1 Tax=Desulfocucumis palustris TaxID=1898651 RepID=A0A2L2XGK0_9FIRM|nr:acyl-CoA carboxylase subunit beta [Desulfocucumis palustris]GBF35124.1 methylcrotonyl-CoA carboxylase carboxyl transferase subunit [Desulfocucumis palustris]
MDLKERAARLNERKEKIMGMGGPEKIAGQHAMNKLTARERIDLLFEPGTFVEMGILAHHHSSHPGMKNKETPADGVIAGYGKIDGRLACVAAYDYTVMAGSMGESGEKKVGRIRQWALKHRVPMIWLIDSAGARIQEAVGSMFAVSGSLFFEEVVMSGVIPQVCAVMGPGAAGTAYIPALADFVPMVKDKSFLALGGPPLVKAMIGEDVDENTLGGSKVHCETSGVGDLEVENDQDCISAVKEYLSYFPSHNRESPPAIASADDPDRYVEELLNIVPGDQRKRYNMLQVIEKIVDGGRFFQLKPGWAKNIITCLARMNGMVVGILANQPMVQGGVLDINAADKSARFINLCDAFNIPLVFLMDVPGFMIGSAVEKQGIIRHGAKMLYAVSEATVPKITVVLRKAYGAGYYVMCGRAFEPDLIVAWPGAEISVMGPEGAVNIVFRKQIEASPDPKTAREMMIGEVRKLIDPEIAASHAYVDDIIDPGDTRRVIIRGLEMAKNKEIHRPWKKHGVVPV